MKIGNREPSNKAGRWVRVMLMGLLLQGALSAGSWAQEVRVHPTCGEMKGRADVAFRQCLTKIKVNAGTRTVQSAVKRCEKSHSRSYERVEKVYRASCVGTQNRTEAKAEVFYTVNQQRQTAGVTRMLMATPGTDVLAWVYPAWTDDGSAMTALFNSAGTTYTTQLQKNGYKPLVGLALPVIGYKSSHVLSPVDQYCPYAQTSYPENTYLPGLQSIKGTAGIDTVIGIANIGPSDDWSQQSTQSIVTCLNNFNGLVTGLMIDDEYNRLTTDQINAMLNWCETSLPNSFGRCGLVLGHNGMVIAPNTATLRQDICMDYGTDLKPNPNTPSATCREQNSGYTRNLYNQGVPSTGTPLPFSIYTALQ